MERNENVCDEKSSAKIGMLVDEPASLGTPQFLVLAPSCVSLIIPIPPVPKHKQ